MYPKHIKKLQIFLLMVILFTVFYSFEKSKEREVVVIEYSANEDQDLLDSLYDKGFIKNKLSYWSIRLLTRFTGKELEPGGYSLSKSMGALALYSQLVDPEYKYVSIGSGLRKEQIANIYGEKLGWDEEKKNKFSKKIEQCSFSGGEGYLSPGTYFIHKDERIGKIKVEMQDAILSTVKELQKEYGSDMNVASVVTIASLIEKESGGARDMRLISGIIQNRIEKDMKLQIDATLQYVKGNANLWWPTVIPDDKYLDSPFNTYQNSGLPPSPIANPSKVALAAAMNPIDTSCLFYLHDKRGNIHCSSTYSGHKQNIINYLR